MKAGLRSSLRREVIDRLQEPITSHGIVATASNVHQHRLTHHLPAAVHGTRKATINRTYIPDRDHYLSHEGVNSYSGRAQVSAVSIREMECEGCLCAKCVKRRRQAVLEAIAVVCKAESLVLASDCSTIAVLV